MFLEEVQRGNTRQLVLHLAVLLGEVSYGYSRVCGVSRCIHRGNGNGGWLQTDEALKRLQASSVEPS